MSDGSEKSFVDTARETAADMAGDVRDAASDKMRREAEHARDSVASEARRTADAAQAAASQFDAGSVQAQALEHVASKIDELAAQIRSSDVERVTRAVGDAARRNPLVFVAGAALVGFAATRFLKARDPQRHEAEDDPWGTAGAYGVAGAPHDVTARGTL